MLTCVKILLLLTYMYITTISIVIGYMHTVHFAQICLSLRGKQEEEVAKAIEANKDNPDQHDNRLPPLVPLLALHLK